MYVNVIGGKMIGGKFKIVESCNYYKYEFENMLNENIANLKDRGCVIQDIKYSTASYSSDSKLRSALIFYGDKGATEDKEWASDKLLGIKQMPSGGLDPLYNIFFCGDKDE